MQAIIILDFEDKEEISDADVVNYLEELIYNNCLSYELREEKERNYEKQ